MTKILVIEDEYPLRREVLSWLQLEGFEAIGAEHGRVGVDLATEYIPDLIVSDVMMPHLDGYGVLLEIRANPATADIPFIFLTALADRDDLRKGMDLGADDYLTKPFKRAELLTAIRVRLEKKEMQLREQRQQVTDLNLVLTEERELRLMKSRLSAMVAHDFGNHLAAILASNSLLRNYGDRMPAERRLLQMNRIDSSVRQLLQMVDEMLFAVQLESGRLESKPKLIDLNRLLQEIVDEFQQIHAETHTLNLRSWLDNSTLVRLDKKLMRQIVTNLLSNAIKYSASGSEIRIEVEDEDGSLQLRVADQGIGIPKENQQDLFEAFHRASNVGSIKGTGLGLAIVKQAVDLQHGVITFESEENVGTLFTISIPQQQASD